MFNTAIAAVMELMNTLAKFDDTIAAGPRRRAGGARADRADALADRAARRVTCCGASSGTRDALIDRPWPKPDPRALVQDTHRDRRAGQRQAARPRDSRARTPAKIEIREAALADATVQKWVEGKPVRKVIVVKGKLVNVVV